MTMRVVDDPTITKINARKISKPLVANPINDGRILVIRLEKIDCFDYCCIRAKCPQHYSNVQKEQ